MSSWGDQVQAGAHHDSVQQKGRTIWAAWQGAGCKRLCATSAHLRLENRGRRCSKCTGSAYAHAGMPASAACHLQMQNAAFPRQAMWSAACPHSSGRKKSFAPLQPHAASPQPAVSVQRALDTYSWLHERTRARTRVHAIPPAPAAAARQATAARPRRPPPRCSRACIPRARRRPRAGARPRAPCPVRAPPPTPNKLFGLECAKRVWRPAPHPLAPGC
jgi:hypothetical protein